MLVAEVDGELQAALTLAGDDELTNPYLPTAALGELLALRAEHLHGRIDTVTPGCRCETA